MVYTMKQKLFTVSTIFLNNIIQTCFTLYMSRKTGYKKYNVSNLLNYYGFVIFFIAVFIIPLSTQFEVFFSIIIYLIQQND